MFYIITCSLATLYNFILSIQIILYWKNRMPESMSENMDVINADLEVSELDKSEQLSMEDTELEDRRI